MTEIRVVAPPVVAEEHGRVVAPVVFNSRFVVIWCARRASDISTASALPAHAWAATGQVVKHTGVVSECTNGVIAGEKAE